MNFKVNSSLLMMLAILQAISLTTTLACNVFTNQRLFSEPPNTMKETKDCRFKTYAAISHAHIFSRLETGKVVWVLSFDLSRIRINIAFRYSYAMSVLQHFIDKKK